MEWNFLRRPVATAWMWIEILLWRFSSIQIITWQNLWWNAPSSWPWGEKIHVTHCHVKWSGPFSPKFWPSESCLVYLSAIRITWCGWVPSPQWLAWPDSAEETARDRTDGGNARPPPRGKQKWWMGKRLQGKCGRRTGIVIFFLAKKRPKGSYEFFFDDLHWELKTMQFSPQTFGFHEKYC